MTQVPSAEVDRQIGEILKTWHVSEALNDEVRNILVQILENPHLPRFRQAVIHLPEGYDGFLMPHYMREIPLLELPSEQRSQILELVADDIIANHKHFPLPMEQLIPESLDTVLAEQKLPYTEVQKQHLRNWLLARTLGLDILEPLLADRNVVELLVWGTQPIATIRDNQRYTETLAFDDPTFIYGVAYKLWSRTIFRYLPPADFNLKNDPVMLSVRAGNGSQYNCIVFSMLSNGPLLHIVKPSA
jgi:hypothetical protein